MDKIKAFIEYSVKMKQEILEAKQLENELYLFQSNSYSAFLQSELEKRAEAVGIKNIMDGSNGLTVHLNNETFHTLDFQNIMVTTSCTNGVSWTHFKVAEGGVIFTACQETKNASAYAAPALYAN
ncbi:hypothetical protein [Lysinibacillus pakistanensis]|uniref:Competence protein ComK n=1 Tax=Lysinibacillus pakistanensis TaxID=759811 RepID=A0ABX6DAR2_9BACI|nr:hypothetical protein GDS87_11700 [Lysinibacillus pakistanensis]